MKNYNIIILILLFCCVLLTPKTYALALSPETIIANNEIINIDNILNNSDTYTFKMNEIKNQINNFKQNYIDNINTYINNQEWQNAKTYIEKYLNFFSSDIQILSLYKLVQSNLNTSSEQSFSGNIEVLSFKPLIAYPSTVLNTKNSFIEKLEENHITCNEFNNILLSLYEKNYILISPDVIFKNGELITDIKLPANKKPLILILEDVNYDTKSNGSVEKLIIDHSDKIATYTPKRSINDRIHSDNDFVTILENFVASHPSFSYNNAKAIIAVDGSKGIFGYDTAKTNATSKYQIKKASQIINYLKDHGYTFAASGYKHRISDSSIDFASALNSWNNEVKSIIDPSNIFFLNANMDLIDEDKDYKFKLLRDYGFNFCIGLDMSNKFIYSPLINGAYITAKQINGKTLRYSTDALSHLFSCEQVYDHVNRTITYSKE